MKTELLTNVGLISQTKWEAAQLTSDDLELGDQLVGRSDHVLGVPIT
jgi:hypothetical protein